MNSIKVNSISLSNDQQYALDMITHWIMNGTKNYMTLGGLAGTGKTTIIGQIEHQFDHLNIIYCALSGKATQMIRQSLEKNGVITRAFRRTSSGQRITVDKVSTIHSLVYSPLELFYCGCGNCETERVSENVCPTPQLGDTGKPITEVVYHTNDAELTYDLIVVDEASMINKKIWTDLSNLGIPILAVGDHGQLPPIGDSFDLMSNPDIRLEIIHRQNSNNPILQLAYYAREHGVIPFGDFSTDEFPNVKKTNDPGELDIDPHNTMVICGLRRTRASLNNSLRQMHGFTSPLPEINERVICLRNIRNDNVFNGMLGRIDSASYIPGRQSSQQPEIIDMTIIMENGHSFEGPVWTPQFGKKDTTNEFIPRATLWDYGYAITCHKAQGSESDDVVLFEEPFGSEESKRRWLYTAITRAKNSLTVIKR